MKRIPLTLFILACCFSFAGAKQLPADTNYFELRQGLDHFYHAVVKEQKATIAFLGGSITFNPGWRDKVCAYLTARFPQTRFHFIAAGIPSLGSQPHAFRVQRDVLDSGKVDLLFFEAAVNDKVNGTDSLTQYRSLEGVVRHARKSNPDMDIIMMSFADPDKTADYTRGMTPGEVYRHESVAGYYGLPSVNLAREVADKLNKKVFSWEKDFIDLHPSPFGQELYFKRIRQLLAAAYEAYAAGAGRKLSPHKRPEPLTDGVFDKGDYANIRTATHDAGWRFDADWKPANGQETRPGFVRVPMLVSTVPGSELNFDFKGNAVGIAVVSGADAGIISYRIDDGQPQQRDLFTAWSSWLHLPWYLCLGSGLSPGKHNLTLTVAPGKNTGSKGNAVRIVYFLVNKPK